MNANACIQERHLSETVGDGFVFILRDCKNAIVGFEMNGSTSLICFPNFAGRILWSTNLKFLFRNDPISINGSLEI